MSFFAHAVQWRRQMYTAPLGLLLFLARSLLLNEKQWVQNLNEGAPFFQGRFTNRGKLLFNARVVIQT